MVDTVRSSGNQSDFADRPYGQDSGLGITLFDFLKGTPWLGRPIHPMLTYLPIGAWLTAAAFDLVGAEHGADRAIKLGNLAWSPAMLTGCIDWYDTTGVERKVGFVHMCTQCVAMMAYGQSQSARSSGQRKIGIALSSAGLATEIASAWIGTNLVVKYGMGVNPSAWAWLRRRDPARSNNAKDDDHRTVVDQGPTMGCWVQLRDSSGKEVTAQTWPMTYMPQQMRGATVQVTGSLVYGSAAMDSPGKTWVLYTPGVQVLHA